MLASQKQRLLEKTLARLEKSTVVVEGKHDEQALRKAGLHCQIVLVMGRTTQLVIEKLPQNGNIILLTDFDEEGRRKEKDLKQALAQNGLKADEAARKNFRQLFRINTVEQLPYALRGIEAELEAQNASSKSDWRS